ncbi:DUF5107 domain-containing protein [Mucilaginibacter sp. PPCGB 2223]|uniref:tetratricopeptide repeat protein n=1 Tax=Mucilaginibacter sp. PPCGB 2223 TaxID=1886027 RepID=UPI000825DE4D|nr:DUF5107 domain-containing protein [Mucilaginibacter sp. PPCGB 2223]OCX52338.1 DUF5107 domain-containing protein [Mucilaginibacter sp. PPCGB 2223]
MENNTVKSWIEKVIIPTYPTGAPDKNPMFFEKRVYQGSSGVVYPNPVIEKIFDVKVDREYTGVFLENRYLKIMILPELGGRVQMAYDKIKQRHFIYYNQVIKPALVGLCGPWISGGIEFNWPQHHRPSTFEPVDFCLEDNADGSKTVWVNELEKMFGTKGMAGFTLYPDNAYLEIKARLYNHSNLPQTFLWWANPAVKVNDDYQSVFPPDVNAVFDHGKRDVSTFPIATGTYYKVDYSPGTDISRYKNIPVPTSYMAVNSEYNFVGGYEHDTRAGVLHVADHHVSPGKKQWTWGNGDFGVAWDRNLTDEDGPYIELMTGVFTDNQPDFSWLMPNEEKSFTQYFLPYRELGVVKNASKDILIGYELLDGKIEVKVFATSPMSGVHVKLYAAGTLCADRTIDISPEKEFIELVPVANNFTEKDLRITVADRHGRVLLSYSPADNKQNEVPQPAKPALQPAEVSTCEELFLTGQHLEQYRHATYSPVPYYEEALKRDPGDARNNSALGLWYLRRGQFAKSEPYLRKATETITRRNPNPYDGEPYYNLGLCLAYQRRFDEAYDAFFKATWNSAWQDNGFFAVAQIDMMRGGYEPALEHIGQSLDRNARNGRANTLKIMALLKLGRMNEALAAAEHALKADKFNLGALFATKLCYAELKMDHRAQKASAQLMQLSRGTANNLVAYAIDFAAMGLYDEAIALLLKADDHQAEPMVNYYLAYYSHLAAKTIDVEGYLQKAAKASPALCFPNRLEDIMVLRYAIGNNPADAKASYYLGNLWYDKRQYDDALTAWQLSAQKDGNFPTVLRNLGIAYFNKFGNAQQALASFEKAFELDPSDARVLMELDQLYKRLNYSLEHRLKVLEDNLQTTLNRDDLYLERASVYNFNGEHQRAFDMLMDRRFHPWEGGEGKVSAQYLFSLTELAKQAIANGDYNTAIELLTRAQTYPENLGEGKLPGAQENDIFYWMGCAYQQLGQNDGAILYWQKASSGLSEPSAAMFYNDQQPDKIFYQGLAWQKLGSDEKAKEIFKKLIDYGKTHIGDDIRLDYFAVSLPDLLVFEDDLSLRNKLHCLYMMGLGYLGSGLYDEAAGALQQVLTENGMHFGAATHLKLAHKPVS